MSKLICGCAASLFLFFALLACTPQPNDKQQVVVEAVSAKEIAAYAELKPLLQQHCIMCHSAKPAIPAYPSAPAGVALETPAQLRQFAARVVALAQLTHTMPPANFTGMTKAERDQLGVIVRKTWLQENSAASTKEAANPMTTAAEQAYLWGYPLVYNMDVFENFLAGKSPRFSNVAWNRFSHARALQGPQDKFVSPNIDVLFSLALCNLNDGPLVVRVPDTQGRYYVLQFLDPWTNNFAYIGRRATGTKPGEYLIAGKDYGGPVPQGMTLIRAPAKVFAIVGRVAVDDEHDLSAVHAVQNGFGLRPLNSGGEKPEIAEIIPQGNSGVPAELRFWERLRVLLAVFPPPTDERSSTEQFASLGLFNKTSPYVTAELQLAELLPAAEKAAKTRLAVDIKNIVKTINGWGSVIHLFDYNTHYLELGTLNTPQWKIADYQKAYHTRAAAARLGLWGNHGYEAAFFQVWTDGSGQQLNGGNRYQWTLPEAPPAKAFWSLTMYDVPKFYLVANPIHRYAISSTTRGLKYNTDGSLTIYLQQDSPGPGRESNWLPTPAGDFRPLLSIYEPEVSALQPAYTLPPIVRSK